MTVITEAELREMWQSGKGNIAILPQDTKFTPSAKDFIKDWKLQIAYEGKHTPSLSAEVENEEASSDEKVMIARAEQSPQFLLKGKTIIPAPIIRTKKSNSPRLLLKGQPVLTALLSFENESDAKQLYLAKIDTLTAHFLLATAQARRFNLPKLGDILAQLAAHTHAIATAGRKGQTIPPLKSDALFNAQTNPDAPLSPVPKTHEMLLYLNLLRAQINEVRLWAKQAHCPNTFTSALVILADAVNRLLY